MELTPDTGCQPRPQSIFPLERMGEEEGFFSFPFLKNPGHEDDSMYSSSYEDCELVKAWLGNLDIPPLRNCYVIVKMMTSRLNDE